jgi:hypothetical protein
MTVGMRVAMHSMGMTGSVEAGSGTRKTRKQDRRPRHGRVVKALSAHGFARHGRARGECRGGSQDPMNQGTFGCRLRPAALGYLWYLP